MTIGSIFGVNPPVVVTNSKALPLQSPHPSLVYGVELEIENASFDWGNSFWTSKEDGSLRNGGVEFVSKPATFSNLVQKLTRFYDEHPLKNTPDNGSNFSDRTSIHVHTNCTDLTEEQLSSICLMYSVCERLLYNYIGHDRDKNIFCVPWYETLITHNMISQVVVGNLGNIKMWQKYTGLNLLTLSTLGTIEWRHMHGNNDLDFIVNWLKLISHHYRVAHKYSFNDLKNMLLNLNTSSKYTSAIDTLFEGEALLLKCPNYEVMMEDGVLSAKYAYFDNGKVKSRTQDNNNTATNPIPVPSDMWFVTDAERLNLNQNNLDIWRARLRQHVFQAAGVANTNAVVIDDVVERD